VGVLTRRMAALQQAAAAAAGEARVTTTRALPVMKTPGTGRGRPLESAIFSTPGNMTSSFDTTGLDFSAIQGQRSGHFQDIEQGTDDQLTTPFTEQVLAHHLRVLSRTGLVRETAGDMAQTPLWYVPATTPLQTVPIPAGAALATGMAGGMAQSPLTGPVTAPLQTAPALAGSGLVTGMAGGMVHPSVFGPVSTPLQTIPMTNVGLVSRMAGGVAQSAAAGPATKPPQTIPRADLPLFTSLTYVDEVEEARSAMGGSRASRNARSKHHQHKASSLGSSKASELKAELRAELNAELSAELTMMKMAMAEMQARMAGNQDVTNTVPKVVFTPQPQQPIVPTLQNDVVMLGQTTNELMKTGGDAQEDRHSTSQRRTRDWVNQHGLQDVVMKSGQAGTQSRGCSRKLC
jgi:hypothetical protein